MEEKNGNHMITRKLPDHEENFFFKVGNYVFTDGNHKITYALWELHKRCQIMEQKRRLRDRNRMI